MRGYANRSAQVGRVRVGGTEPPHNPKGLALQSEHGVPTYARATTTQPPYLPVQKPAPAVPACAPQTEVAREVGTAARPEEDAVEVQAGTGGAALVTGWEAA